MITPQNLARHEMIGLDVTIEKSSNPGLSGLKGRVVDETRNTFTIESKEKDVQVIKETCIFLFSLPSGERVRIDGKILVSRPEDRVKKKLKNW